MNASFFCEVFFLAVFARVLWVLLRVDGAVVATGPVLGVAVLIACRVCLSMPQYLCRLHTGSFKAYVVGGGSGGCGGGGRGGGENKERENEEKRMLMLKKNKMTKTEAVTNILMKMTKKMKKETEDTDDARGC